MRQVSKYDMPVHAIDGPSATHDSRAEWVMVIRWWHLHLRDDIFFFEKHNGHVLGEHSHAVWQRLSLDLITGPLSTKQVLYIAACTCIVRVVGKSPARPSSHWQGKNLNRRIFSQPGPNRQNMSPTTLENETKIYRLSLAQCC